MALVMSGPRWNEGRADSASRLVEEARSGDRRAFDELVRLHERRVLMTALRMLGQLEDAQDASQEVFLRLYKYLGRFDPGRSLEPWLYRVTLNVCRDLGRRRAKSSRLLLGEDALETIAGGADADVLVEQADRSRILADGLKTLTEKERTTLVLRDIEGLSTREVARVMGSTPLTVRSHLSRARLKMREHRDRVLGRKP